MVKQATKMKRLIKAIWIFNWFNSCGFAELVPVVGSRWDMERFGMIITGTPRHASYNTIKNLSDYIPVNIYIPGCPPRPEAVFEACMKIFHHVGAVPPHGKKFAKAHKG